MKYFLITILSLLFFSSFKTVHPEGVCDPQFVLSDSCRLSKIYLNDTLQKVYHYDDMKNIIRIDYYGGYPKEWKGKVTGYDEFKHDELGRMIEYSGYMAREKLDSNGHALMLWTKRVFVYSGNQLSEIRWYSPDGLNRDKEPFLSAIEKITYDAKNQIVEVYDRQVEGYRFDLSYGGLKRKKLRDKKRSQYKIKYDDRGNPIYIEIFKIRKFRSPQLVSTIVREYDSAPNFHSSIIYKDYNFPIVNNLISEKRIYLNHENTWKENEYKTNFQYNKQGFIASLFKPQNTDPKTTFPNRDLLYSYEYICD